MTKRPGTQSGDDRDQKALERLRREAAAQRSSDPGFTPVRHILDIVEVEYPGLAPVVQMIWSHTANLEMRLNARLGDQTSFENIHQRVDEQQDEIDLLNTQFNDLREDLAKKFTDLVGINGTNGKVGTLRVAVEKLYARIWWAATFVVGAVSGAAVKLVLIVMTYAEMKSQIEANRTQIQLLQSAMYKAHTATDQTPGKVP